MGLGSVFTNVDGQAYIKLLERENLWPAHLTHTFIFKALESAETIPDPLPEESSTICTYGYKHAAPAYRSEWSSGGKRKKKVAAYYIAVGLCVLCPSRQY